jgi:hypothetical protein
MENPSIPSMHFSQEGVLSLYRGSRNDGRLERSAASLKTPRSRGGNTNASFFKESHVTGGAGGSGPRPPPRGSVGARHGQRSHWEFLC